MLQVPVLLHQKCKILKKLLFGFFYGNLAEFLEVLHELEGSLACACAGSLVVLRNLSFGIYGKEIHVLFNLFYEFFHF